MKIPYWEQAQDNYLIQNRCRSHINLWFDIRISYNIPFIWYWFKYQLLRDGWNHIKYEYRQRFGKKIYGASINFGGLALMMVKDPAYIWENGKKHGITNKREAEEYAKQKGLVMGGDDLEQEAAHNKKMIENESTDRIVNKTMETLERRRYSRG